MKKSLIFILLILFAFSCKEKSEKPSSDGEIPDTQNGATDINLEPDDGEMPDVDCYPEGYYRKVRISSGLVAGTLEKGIISFKGIPYAQPPVGELRWKKPVEELPWSGELKAETYSKSCPQTMPVAPGVVLPWDEDCLYLNVFRPDNANPYLPVMVFIHGGGYVNGGAALATYEGSWLASKDVVLVTINYRLGQLGFVTVPDTKIAGNYGTLDQILALEWVQKNIKAFGGNPENVTIFGESAGAISVGTMMALRPDLFRKAIIQSGTIPWGDTMKKSDANNQGTRFVEAAGCDKAADIEKCLREKTAEEILSYLEGGVDANVSELYGPHVDGTIFTKLPYKMVLDGEGKNIPLIIGTNEDEGTVFTIAYKDYIQTEEQYENIIKTQFGEISAPTILNEYPASEYESPWHAYTDIFADLYFNCSTILMIRDLAKHSKEARYYRFSHLPDYGAATGLGCFHGAELGYLFNTWDDYFKNNELGYQETTDNITDLWVKFATDGTLPDWPVYDSDEKYLNISSELKVEEKLEKKNCDFWGQYIKVLY
ncbi:MAG: carboxylesterase/lipase family protein [bacterium]